MAGWIETEATLHMLEVEIEQPLQSVRRTFRPFALRCEPLRKENPLLMLMRDKELRDDKALEPQEAADERSAGPLELAPPITNRFLLVNVAPVRAKQLRRNVDQRDDGYR